MIDAAVARFGWCVLGLAIAATIAVRLATPDCELWEADPSIRQAIEAERTQAKFRAMDVQMAKLDRVFESALDVGVTHCYFGDHSPARQKLRELQAKQRDQLHKLEHLRWERLHRRPLVRISPECLTNAVCRDR